MFFFSFGWDWGPAFAGVGIWQPVYLQAYSAFWLNQATALVNPVNDSVTAFDVEIRVWVQSALPGASAAELSCVVGDLDVAGVTSVTLQPGPNAFNLRLLVQNPPLWYQVLSYTCQKCHIDTDPFFRWPRGYGAQPLFNAQVTFSSSGASASQNVTIGFRKFAVDTSAAGSGQTGNVFAFLVNDLPIFVKVS